MEVVGQKGASRIQGFNEASLGDNSMLDYSCKWELQQPQSKEAKATQAPWGCRSESLLPESNLAQPRCWQRVREVLNVWWKMKMNYGFGTSCRGRDWSSLH